MLANLITPDVPELPFRLQIVEEMILIQVSSEISVQFFYVIFLIAAIAQAAEQESIRDAESLSTIQIIACMVSSEKRD